jgi:hypothetical protein
MKKNKKYILIFIYYILSYQLTLADSSASWAKSLFWTDKINEKLKVWWNDLIITLDNIFWYIIWLFYFIAVVFWVYWWFLILVSWWDDEKVKKWKNIVLYMIYWLVIIFLASQIVNWVIKVMSSDEIIWKVI